MRGNIFTRLGPGIAPRPVTQPLQRSTEQPEPFLQTAKHLAIKGQDFQKRRELRGFPFAIQASAAARLPPVKTRQ